VLGPKKRRGSLFLEACARALLPFSTGSRRSRFCRKWSGSPCPTRPSTFLRTGGDSRMTIAVSSFSLHSRGGLSGRCFPPGNRTGSIGSPAESPDLTALPENGSPSPLQPRDSRDGRRITLEGGAFPGPRTDFGNPAAARKEMDRDFWPEDGGWRTISWSRTRRRLAVRGTRPPVLEATAGRTAKPSPLWRRRAIRCDEKCLSLFSRGAISIPESGDSPRRFPPLEAPGAGAGAEGDPLAPDRGRLPGPGELRGLRSPGSRRKGTSGTREPARGKEAPGLPRPQRMARQQGAFDEVERIGGTGEGPPACLAEKRSPASGGEMPGEIAEIPRKPGSNTERHPAGGGSAERRASAHAWEGCPLSSDRKG